MGMSPEMTQTGFCFYSPDWFLKLTSDMDCWEKKKGTQHTKIHLNFMRQFLKGMLVDDAWSRNSICVFTFWLIARNHLEHEGVVQYYGKTTIHFYLRHSGDIKKGERTTLALSLPALFQFIASCLGFWQQELLLCPLQNMLRTASNFTLKKEARWRLCFHIYDFPILKRFLYGKVL